MTTQQSTRCNSEPTIFAPAHLQHAVHALKTITLHAAYTQSLADTGQNRYNVSQADVAVFKALKSSPAAAKYPNAARWYKHVASYEDEFATLAGDASKPYTAYGPEAVAATLNPAKAPAKEADEDDDDVDLFGSDDEEEDAEAARIRDERLAEYRKKKEAKPKAAAKSLVTLDVKPWGMWQAALPAEKNVNIAFC